MYSFYDTQCHVHENIKPLNVSYIQRTKRIALMYNVPHLDITASYDRSTCPCSLTNIFSQTGQCVIGHRTFNILAEIPPVLISGTFLAMVNEVNVVM